MKQAALIVTVFTFFIADGVLSQNVGIGTNTPSEKLHVVGGARVTSLSGGTYRLVQADANGVLSNIIDGTSGQFLTTNGAGVLSWANGGYTDADNGLYYNAGVGRIRMGGPLVEVTTITQGVYNLTFNLSGTGDFRIQDAGVNHFEVNDGGRTTFGEDTYWRDISTTGTIIGRFYDSGDDGVFQVYRNGSVQHSINSVGTTVFNEQSGSYDFRIESNGKANMFFVDGSTDRIGINVAAPLNIVDMLETAAIGGTDACQSQLNGSTGGALDAVINNTANGYNSFEAIHNGTGSCVFALHSGIGTDNIALRAQVASSNDRWGLYSSDEAIALAYFIFSDKRLKDNINKIEGGLSVINRLNPVQYNWKKGNEIHATSDALMYGFLAQELKEVVPHLVADNVIPVVDGEIGPDMDLGNVEHDYHAVNYQGLIPFLTKAIQEQQEIIEGQNEKIDRLEKEIVEIKALLQK